MEFHNQPLIIADPEICHGKPTFRGTRVMVWQVLELLEVGTAAQEMYQAYPTLPQGAIEAALHYAAEKAKGVRHIPLKVFSHESAAISA